MKSWSLFIFFVLLHLGFPTVTCCQGRHDLNNLFTKDDITLVITDSGLGGLSVMDDISKKLTTSREFKKVRLIFVNALFDANSGYNALRTREEKIQKFSQVMTAIGTRYHPDAIFIGCNTLSVLFDETDFAAKSDIPVIGIVKPGVQLIREKLEKDPASRVIIFGTETTIEENSHKKQLTGLNIAPDRIWTKACPQLQSYIEQNPSGEETGMLISVYLNEALEQLPKKSGKLYLSLNCSHFGYSLDLWKKALPESSGLLFDILDPNERMGDDLVSQKYLNRFNSTQIIFQVVSKVELSNLQSLSNLFKLKSPGLATALENYAHIPDLF